MTEITTTPLLSSSSSSSCSTPGHSLSKSTGSTSATAQEEAELRRQNEGLRAANRQVAQRLDRLVQALGAVLDVLPADGGCVDTLQAVAAELESLRDGVGVGQPPLMPRAIPPPRR